MDQKELNRITDELFEAAKADRKELEKLIVQLMKSRGARYCFASYSGVLTQFSPLNL